MTTIYSEKHISIGVTIILGLVTLLMAIYLGAQLVYGPIGSKPAPDWILWLLTAVFFGSTLNFSTFSVSLTDEGVAARYGVFCASRKWSEVTSCEEDSEHLFYGWGIRFGSYKKQWIWIYNVISGSRVVFLNGGTKPKGLMVSTKNPAELLRIASERIDLRK